MLLNARPIHSISFTLNDVDPYLKVCGKVLSEDVYSTPDKYEGITSPAITFECIGELDRIISLLQNMRNLREEQEENLKKMEEEMKDG